MDDGGWVTVGTDSVQFFKFQEVFVSMNYFVVIDVMRASARRDNGLYIVLKTKARQKLKTQSHISNNVYSGV